MIKNHIKLIENKTYEDGLMTITFDSKVTIKISYDKVYGLGERYNSIDHKGKVVVNIVEEQFCNQGEKTYFPLPFFMLDNGCGFFIDTKETIEFDFKEDISIKIDDTLASLYLLKGTYKEMIHDFVSLTGQTLKAPKWVFGPWLSAHRWNSQEIVDQVRQNIKDLKIPVTVIVLEQWSDEATFYIFNGAEYPEKDYLTYDDFTFDKSPWYDPKQMVKDLHADGIRLLLWQCPVVKHIPEDEPFNLRHDKEWHMVAENKLAVQSANGPYRIPDGNWFNGSMIPDFTNEKTLDWWFKNRQYLLDIGVDGFKTDGGEFIHSDVINSIGETQAQLKNNYSLEYVKAYSDFIGKDRVNFSRAGYTGQQMYSLQWAGDQKSTYDELRSVYKAGINASLSGQINWGFDIAGFSGELPSVDLYYRSNQLAVFTPIMQVHSEPVGGQFSAVDPIRAFNNERTIWNMAKSDQVVLEDIRRLYNLRMNLLPYTYSEYLKALDENSTLMKHMNIEYEGNYSDDQYMYGDLIVAPVLHNGQKTIQVDLPEGKFYNIFTNEVCRKKVLVEDVKINDMFVYIKEGTGLVTRLETLIPEVISNDINSETLYFRLYGQEGSYHFMDENNDFYIIWDNGQVMTEGHIEVEITWSFIND